MASHGLNYYKVQELSKNHRDIVIAQKLSLSRERVRQLRIQTTIKKPYDCRQCTKCGKWFKPTKTGRASKFRSTCGCKNY